MVCITTQNCSAPHLWASPTRVRPCIWPATPRTMEFQAFQRQDHQGMFGNGLWHVESTHFLESIRLCSTTVRWCAPICGLDDPGHRAASQQNTSFGNASHASPSTNALEGHTHSEAISNHHLVSPDAEFFKCSQMLQDAPHPRTTGSVTIKRRKHAAHRNGHTISGASRPLIAKQNPISQSRVDSLLPISDCIPVACRRGSV